MGTADIVPIIKYFDIITSNEVTFFHKMKLFLRLLLILIQSIDIVWMKISIS